MEMNIMILSKASHKQAVFITTPFSSFPSWPVSENFSTTFHFGFALEIIESLIIPVCDFFC